jgi:hypothetical protein
MVLSAQRRARPPSLHRAGVQGEAGPLGLVNFCAY